MKGFLRVLAVMLACAPAQAEQKVIIVPPAAPVQPAPPATPPAMGSAGLQEGMAATAGNPAEVRPYRILVIGDALAGGLGAGMTRLTEGNPGFEIINRFNEVSGIARTEVYDWAASLPNITQDQNYDAAVVLMGTNDRQPIRVGDTRYLFNTREWIAAYTAQTDKILTALKAANLKVFWVSIPPMGDGFYDADLKVMLALQRGQVTAAGATFIDIRPAFSTPEGQYTDVGADDTGTVRKLRARDGFGFFKQGNNRMGQLVLAAIEKERQAPPPAAAPVAVGLRGSAGDGLPSFGRNGLDGEALTLSPQQVTAVVTAAAQAERAASMIAAGAAAATVAIPVVPGSAADKLFNGGMAPPAQAGRFDDFSLPPAP